MINQHIENERQLTIHACSGTILKQELINALKILYGSELTLNQLWDFTETDFSQIKSDDLQEIAEFAEKTSPTRIGARTALVSASSVGFGLARMFESLAENEGLPVEISVFRSSEEAEEWMFSQSSKEGTTLKY
jgi:hypothetical protein